MLLLLYIAAGKPPFLIEEPAEMQYVQKWLPIVAAAQMTKKHGAEKEFLTRWTQVVEFE